MEILEYIYRNSKLLKNADMCVKITGRLILLNIIPLVNHLGKIKHDFISAYMYGRRKFCDSRFLFFTPKFLPILLAKKEQIYDWKHNFETVTFDAVFEAEKHNIKFIYPPHAERVHGVGGGFGITYDCDDMAYFKIDMKHQVKRFLFKYKFLPRIKE